MGRLPSPDRWHIYPTASKSEIAKEAGSMDLEYYLEYDNLLYISILETAPTKCRTTLSKALSSSRNTLPRRLI